MQIIDTNEAGLIARIVAGEKELFHELIRPYERMVYLTLFAIVKNEAEAEDGAQETVINAYRHLASFRGEAKFSTWLTTIAINEGRKRLRKAKGAAENSIEEQEEGHEGDYTPAPLTDWREIPLEALERKELREALRVAVAELPDIYRQVFVLRNGAGAGNPSWRGESTAAPRANDAAKTTGTAPKNDGSGTQGVLRESAMKLDCKHVWEHISEYIDKTVDAELRKEIELHLEHCEICSAILDSTRNILILTADDRTFELSVGYSERLHERLKDEIEKTKQEPPVGG